MKQHTPPPASRPADAKWRHPDHVMNGDAGAADAVTPDLVGMVPEELLNQDEVVLLLTKPSLFYIFYSSFFFIAVTLAVGAALARVAAGSTILPSPSMIGTLTAVACAGRLIWAMLVWASHVYILTNLRILTVKGVINKHMFQAPLRKIQSTQLYRPLIQRIFGTGTIGFATAAANDGIESTWVMITRSAQVHEMVVAEITKQQSR